jgi:nucleotide-binding universal stress UspA family protein
VFGPGRALADSVTVVHAVGLLEHAGHDPVSGWREEVERLARSGSGGPVPVTWHVEDGDPCSVLLRSAGPPVGAGLIVVGTRGHGGHTGLLLGSTSLELAERSPVPVVVVPPASNG